MCWDGTAISIFFGDTMDDSLLRVADSPPEPCAEPNPMEPDSHDPYVPPRPKRRLPLGPYAKTPLAAGTLMPPTAKASATLMPPPAKASEKSAAPKVSQTGKFAGPFPCFLGIRRCRHD